ncbi:MAG TPA: hypothetical protein VGC99_15400, partial [Candidatus Tectomicrobia bacterium]
SVSLMLDETMIPPPATVPEPESCPPATNETESYRDRIAGYCLLYPAGYRIDAALPGVLTISAPLVDDVAEVRPSLYIITVAGEGLSLPEVRAEMTEQYPDAALVVSEITIGGQPAIIIGVPRDVMSNRQGFIVYQDDLYILLAEPVDAAYPKATPVTENLWQVVIASLTFMAPTERATLVPQTFADLGLSIMMPDDWTVEAQPGVYHLMSFDPTRQGAPFTISLGSISGLPSDDFEAMISAALADFEAQGERSLVYEPFITGNGAMVGATIFGLQRVCRMMLIPGVDLVRTITVRMDTCNDAGGISDPVVSAILNSVTLLDVAE